MQDQLVVGVFFVFVWCDLEQFLFDFEYGFVWCQVGLVVEFENVCVDGDGWLVEGGVEDYIGCFLVYFRECFEGGMVGWDFVVMLVEQDVVGGDDVICFGLIEVDGFDVVVEFFDIECQYLFWGWCIGEEVGGCFVDFDIGGLG